MTHSKATQRAVVSRLLEEHGRTYAEEAGIRLRDKPSPLFQLLVLTLLSSTRIRADIAASSARELFSAGWRTPHRMRHATWQERVDALGRGGYRRYDESTSTRLEEVAGLVEDDYGGDLRRFRTRDGTGVAGLRDALTVIPGIGPVGAGIFCREVQSVWPEVAPCFDERGRDHAQYLGLPRDPERLAELAGAGAVAELAAALIRDRSASPD